MIIPIIDTVINALGKAADKIFPDATKALEVKAAIATAAAALDTAKLTADLQIAMAQTNINLEDAKSGKWFQANWRPAVGWSCALGLFYDFLLRPFMIAFGVDHAPQLDLSTMLPLLGGMLGLGVLRTVEKSKGVN